MMVMMEDKCSPLTAPLHKEVRVSCRPPAELGFSITLIRFILVLKVFNPGLSIVFLHNWSDLLTIFFFLAHWPLTSLFLLHKLWEYKTNHQQNTGIIYGFGLGEPRITQQTECELSFQRGSKRPQHVGTHPDTLTEQNNNKGIAKVDSFLTPKCTTRRSDEMQKPIQKIPFFLWTSTSSFVMRFKIQFNNRYTTQDCVKKWSL